MTDTNTTTADPIGRLTGLLEQLLAKTAAPSAATDVQAPAAAGSPETTPVSQVPAPPVGTLVAKTVQVEGQEHAETCYGVVVSATDPVTNTATVAWFAQTSGERGDTLTKVE